MSFIFLDKVFVVTGASSGIGAALAQECTRRGAKVVLAARSEERLQALETEILSKGGAALAVKTDVTHPEEVHRLIKKTLERWGQLDVLVNSAGFGIRGPFDQLPIDLIRKNFETNVFAAVTCMQAVIPQFRKQKSGLIVNIESIVGLRAVPTASCYSATKHALHAFSESLRPELAAEGIRVLSICPGLIATDFPKNRILVGKYIETDPVEFYIPVEKCVAEIIKAIERERSQTVITWHAKFLALTQRIVPRLLDRFFAIRYQKMLQAEALKKKSKSEKL